MFYTFVCLLDFHFGGGFLFFCFDIGFGSWIFLFGRERARVHKGEWMGGGDDLGGVVGRENMIKIYFIKMN